MLCTFFGHRDAPGSIKEKVSAVLEELITKDNVDSFFVGHNGSFDRMVLAVLKEKAKKHPHITYEIVLSKIPTDKAVAEERTVFPEGMEFAMPAYAVDKRNRWMLDRAQVVVSYVCRKTGGAAKWTEKAVKKNKRVINLGTVDFLKE